MFAGLLLFFSSIRRHTRCALVTGFQTCALPIYGLSYDDGYEGTHGEADTRRSIAELRAHHIACLCISVGSGADDMRLRRVFGEAAFLRTDDSAHVARRIGQLFAQAIALVRHR